MTSNEIEINNTKATLITALSLALTANKKIGGYAGLEITIKDKLSDVIKSIKIE